MSATELSEQLEQLSLQLADEQIERLTTYCEQLWDHNTRLNLTRHLDYQTFAQRDVLDSVRLASLLAPNERVLDFGSGGGVPGLVLAILRPDLNVTLSECVGKKARVLEAMAATLELPVRVECDRVQNVIAGKKYSSLTARAVGPLPKMLPWFRKSWKHFGRLLLIKGPRWVEEREAAEAAGQLHGLTITELLKYPMPGRDSHSVVLELRR